MELFRCIAPVARSRSLRECGGKLFHATILYAVQFRVPHFSFQEKRRANGNRHSSQVPFYSPLERYQTVSAFPRRIILPPFTSEMPYGDISYLERSYSYQ